jgi:hypothetical protein
MAPSAGATEQCCRVWRTSAPGSTGAISFIAQAQGSIYLVSSRKVKIEGIRPWWLRILSSTVRVAAAAAKEAKEKEKEKEKERKAAKRAELSARRRRKRKLHLPRKLYICLKEARERLRQRASQSQSVRGLRSLLKVVEVVRRLPHHLQQRTPKSVPLSFQPDL